MNPHALAGVTRLLLARCARFRREETVPCYPGEKPSVLPWRSSPSSVKKKILVDYQSVTHDMKCNYLNTGHCFPAKKKKSHK